MSRQINMKEWIPRIYNEEEPGDLKTLYGQLSRIADNRAVYLSIRRMTEQSKVPLNELVINFIDDGHYADFVMSLRRILESNKGKSKERSVNSIMGLAEAVDDTTQVSRLAPIAQSLGDAPNKIFGHNDQRYSDGQRKLNLASYNDLEEILKELFSILIALSNSLGVALPDKLVATNQFDWGKPFDIPWRNPGYDDSDIWYEI